MLTSGMLPGSNSALTMAVMLTFFALGIIGQSVGSAVFPSLSALAAEQDFDGFKDRLTGALRSVLFLAFPATVVLVLLGEPLVEILLQRNLWRAEDTQATAWALAFYATGIAGVALLEVLSRAFYALEDTWTPVKIGIAAMLSNIGLSLLFIQFVGDPDSLVRGPFAGLALANALTTNLEALLLWWLLRRRIGPIQDRRLLQGAGKALLAALLMGAALLPLLAAWGDQGPLLLLVACAGLGAAIFFGVSLLLGLDEARAVPAMLLRRLRRG
jgi:putative peptidoglycan lipid II flippase